MPNGLKIGFGIAVGFFAIWLSAPTTLRVIDGDTFALAFEHIRLTNIDAPEIFSPRCAAERVRGLRAKAELERLLADGWTMHRTGRDRYGRTLAIVTLKDGRDAGVTLVREGLAVMWGNGRRGWC